MTTNKQAKVSKATRLQPAWKEKLHRGAEIELAKIDHLERLAWGRMDQDEQAEDRATITEELTKDGADGFLVKRMNTSLRRRNAAGWVAVVQWCIELRCKLLGHYSASKVKVEDEGLRVAGMSTDELHAKMMKRLLEKVEEKRRERAAMRRNGYLG